MDVKEVKIKKITKLDKGRVVNLTVSKNHTFITRNGIVTHNCDRLSTNALDALKKGMVDFADNCSVLFMTNHIERFPQANLSRFKTISLLPTEEKEIKQLKMMFYRRLLWILDQEEVQYQTIERENKNKKKIKIAPVVKKIVDRFYPDFRSAIIASQEAVTMYGQLDENALEIQQGISDDLVMALKNNIGIDEIINISNKLDATDFLHSFHDKLAPLLKDESKASAYEIYGYHNGLMSKAISKPGQLACFIIELSQLDLKFK